jgi:hypothetical protein
LKAPKQRKKPAQFLLCVRNYGCEELDLRKIYQVLPDPSARKEGYVRVIDESGEDYLYPADYFVPVALPAEVANSLAASA